MGNLAPANRLWEIKGNTSALSKIQKLPAEFVMTRTFDAIKGDPERYSVAAQELAQKVWDTPPDRIKYGVLRVTFDE